jgi:FAD/FMN-containing dehydrogenase
MNNNPILSVELLARFAAIVGDGNALTEPADKASYLEENRGIFKSASPLVLRPGSTEEVSKILALASETGASIVPQGGNTGHVGGSVANPEKCEIIVSLSRMIRIREVDARGNSMTVEAGVILQQAQAEAEKCDRLFPLSLGSQGTCQIGGNLSTNAGGTGVLAYGNTRDLVLGIEVVLPTGEIWQGLRKLRKDNTGYDLKDLFIGAEGTLGIITAAVLKLFPKSRGREVAYVGFASPNNALQLFNHVQEMVGNSLTGFELMPRIGVEFVIRNIPDMRDPLENPYPWYALVEISSSRSGEDARNLMEEALGSAIETEIIEDAALAQSLAQQNSFWQMRESMSVAQKPEGGSIKHDISVAVADVPAFLEEAEKIVNALIDDARIVAFGHLGDGNIHYNISQPVSGNLDKFLSMRETVNLAIHDLVREFNGSISAEHGIGLMKRDEMARSKPTIELDLMKRIKASFDPANIMNPGKVL